MKRLAAALLLACTAACATTMRRSMPPAPGDWLATLGIAQAAVVQGHYNDADSVLYDFAQHYPASPEAREAAYWRALFRLDPANPTASPRTAAEQLDNYLNDTDTTIALHRAEARVLRRLASALDSLAHPAPIVVAGDSSSEQAAKAQQREDEMQKEIQRLRDQLDKTTAELERIKKRLQEHSP